MPLIIRAATEDDLPAINAIYNHYVPISTTSYDLEPLPMDQRRRWFAEREPIYPVIVACDGDEVVGWGALNSFRTRPAYRLTVENSVYVRSDRQRTGVGSTIVAYQIKQARELGLHVIVAGIDSEQTASIALHAKHGFQVVGRLPEVGRKFDRWLEVVLMQKIL